ncbi:hypothetical protein [Rhodococcoides fascians]|uniref:hypothetical protein n=1 Tax=Rhodococcoides fascians TaxID=1828 RepID=UPI0024B8D55E|nr:hypothetical protein [Rhodococcus fascians]MDJ0412080.1 hypothetical protein [Rhodococcus fascians]
MGLGVISERLAELLVPSVRARMQRFRFMTAMAVGSIACDSLRDEPIEDASATPAIAFEWLVIEAFVRRIPEVLPGVPGSQKARAVLRQNQRLSPATYLKGPSVFGFNGIYKPLAINLSIVTPDLTPGVKAHELARIWERAHGFDGFVDGTGRSAGARLRSRLTEQIRASVRDGRCSTPTNSALFGELADSLRPDSATSSERNAMRAMVITGDGSRSELAQLLAKRIEDHRAESEILTSIRPEASSDLGARIDAITAYERFAKVLDVCLQTVAHVSYSSNAQPVQPEDFADHENFLYASRSLPALYAQAAEKISAVAETDSLHNRFAIFADPHTPAELALRTLHHHHKIQAEKPPAGKRSWFEEFRGGWVVRSAYGSAIAPVRSESFVHPVRIRAFLRFLQDTSV